MFKRTIFLTAFALSCTFSLPGYAQDVSADTVVATVNGTDITIGHMIVLRDFLPEQYQNLPDETLFDGILDQVIQQAVLAQTVTTPSAAFHIQMENERRTLLASAAMGKIIKEAVTEEALLAAYNEKFADAEPSREYNASHILVETQEEAAALAVELADGADFAALAKEHSTGPSGPGGGSLGWFSAGMMVQPFEEAVVTMDVGQVSEPVQTQFGWHLIKLDDSRLLEQPGIDDVRDELSQELQQKAVEGAITALTASADIVRPDLSAIDRAVLRDTKLVGE